MMKRSLQAIAWVTLMVVCLAACAPAIPPTIMPTAVATSTAETIATQLVASRAAQVQTVEVQITNTTPMQVSAVVRGTFTESCASLGEPRVEYTSSTFQVTILETGLGDSECVQTTTPFEATIALDTNELPAGTYTVIVNGVSALFTLPLENATSGPVATTSSIISQACVDKAAFVEDVTVPDNTMLAANAPFIKTWRLKNTGSCTWDNSYLVHYMSGATMTQSPGYWIVEPGEIVSPGEAVDVSVGMTSPPENGSYRSYWGLKKENGSFMPIEGGASGNSFYVKIQVNSGGSVPVGKITASSIDIVQEQGSGAVCTADATYFVTALITADGPTTASYEIGSTAGQIPAGNFQAIDNSELSPYIVGTVVFDQADTKRIPLRFVGPYPLPDDITVNIRVNGGDWYNAKLSCQ